MTWEVRALLLATLGLAGCPPVIADILNPGGSGGSENDYGTCDPEVVDQLDVLASGERPEAWTDYLRCSTDLSEDACMSDCDDACQAEIAATYEFEDSLLYGYISCGPMWIDDACCVQIYVEDFCCEGRPFLVDGEARVAELVGRSDWCARVAASPVLDDKTRAALVAHWTRAGQQEHASIAAFSRFSLVLLHLGAPADLIRDTHQAALDETRHAELCFGLASRYAGRDIGPGPLPVDEALAGELEPSRVLHTLFLEGCVGETVASLRARVGASHAQDPEVAQVLERIAADEVQHAALAWRTVQWMLGRYPGLREELAALLHTPPRAGATEDPDGLLVHGVLGPARSAQVAADASRQVVGVVGRQLLEQAAVSEGASVAEGRAPRQPLHRA